MAEGAGFETKMLQQKRRHFFKDLDCLRSVPETSRRANWPEIWSSHAHELRLNHRAPVQPTASSFPAIPDNGSCHEFNIAGPKQWLHTACVRVLMYSGGCVRWKLKSFVVLVPAAIE